MSFVASVFCVLFLAILDKKMHCLHVMTFDVPPVVDFRDALKINCLYNMGDEVLYAVKWYKDDQEFFRYNPSQLYTMVVFPVPGIHLQLEKSNCSLVCCNLVLTHLTREHSSGAYKCEISSEAPAFRLASQTQNVTVAAIPKQPQIKTAVTSYSAGDIIDAECVSGPSDPPPILSWHVNGYEPRSQALGDMKSLAPDSNGLISRSLALKFLVEDRYARDDYIELRCIVALSGVPLQPLESVLKIAKRSQDQINQESWFGLLSSGSDLQKDKALVLIVSFTTLLLGILLS